MYNQATASSGYIKLQHNNHVNHDADKASENSLIELEDQLAANSNHVQNNKSSINTQFGIKPYISSAIA